MENKKIILITGSSGFIGKNLIEYFSKKHKIIAPSHSQLDLLDTDAVNCFFKENKIDIVIHAANFGGNRNQPDSPEIVKNNLLMFFNLANNSDYFKKMIFLGSGAEYEKNRNLINVKESSFGDYIPKDNYGFSKFVCSKYLEGSKKIINLRLFGVFGKYENYNLRFISNIICRVIFDIPVEINQNRKMDYLFIDDFCKIVDYFVENTPKNQIYNTSTNNHLDLLSIAKMIKQVSGREFKIVIKNKGMNKEYTCDSSRLIKELNNHVQFTEFKDAIGKLYKWYLNNKDKIKKENLLKY